jgi:Tfp pilus assembly protein PilO
MNKMRQWGLLTAVACLAVLAAGWFLLVKPQHAKAASLRQQAQSIQTSNQSLQLQVNQLRQQQQGLPAQQKKLAQIAAKVPNNPALPALIRQLSTAADAAGVNLVSLAPGQPTLVQATAGATHLPASATGSAAAGSGAASSTTPTATLASIPLALNVQGSYYNLEQFFSNVEGLNRAMLVTGFALVPGGSATGAPSTTSATANSNVLTATINASVFESPQAAPGATTVTGH